MGLDAWLTVKTTKDLNLSDHKTGVCSGLFGMTLVSDDEYELGYLRKAYDQGEIIFKNCYKSEEDCGFLNLGGVINVLKEATDILETHTFDEDGGDDSTDCYTWQSKRKWNDVIDMFTKAKQVLEQDPDAKIKYIIWY